MKQRVKNRKDPRYLKVQERLDSALGRFIRIGRTHRLTIPELSKAASTYKTTFYDHFHHMDAAFEQLNHKYKEQLEQLRKETVSTNIADLEALYSRLLYFIYNNHEYYSTMIYCHNAIPFLEMISIFRIPIIRKWSNYGGEANDYAFQIFSWEASAIIIYWGKKERFSKSKLPSYAKKLAKLSQNATQRLL